MGTSREKEPPQEGTRHHNQIEHQVKLDPSQKAMTSLEEPETRRTRGTEWRPKEKDTKTGSNPANQEKERETSANPDSSQRETTSRKEPEIRTRQRQQKAVDTPKDSQV